MKCAVIDTNILSINFLFTGGYYTIEQKGNKLRIIALNSNAFSTLEGHHGDDPNEQLEWLEKILNKSVKNKETVSALRVEWFKWHSVSL